MDSTMLHSPAINMPSLTGLAAPARLEQAPSVAYADVSKAAGSDVEAAAKQFESLFVNMMLKSMRAATASLTEDNYLSSRHVELHQEMLDQQYASELAGAGGIGLAEVIVRQLSPAARAPDTERADQLLRRTQFSRSQQVPETRSSTVSTEAIAAPADSNEAEHPSRAALFGNIAEFVENAGSVIADAVRGTPLSPVAVLAQAALETGWGQHVPSGDSGSSHNLFGIKADSRWSGASVAIETSEFLGGRLVKVADSFRSYESVAEGVRDYVRFIMGSERYAEAVEVAQEPHRYADALVEAGYATDPAYADKLKALIDQLEQQRDGIAF